LLRRDFLRLLALAAAAGASLRPRESDAQAASALYDVPRFGNVSLIHFTDAHAQLLPLHFREPSVNLGIGSAEGRPPHLVGEAFLKHFHVPDGSAAAHAFTHLEFTAAARRYGRLGGFAHMASLIKRLRAERPGALLLDGGDSWQGSATALWTRGADMIGAQKLLGVDATTGHWEFTYGAERVKQAVEAELGPIAFLAQNVKTTDFEEPVFSSYKLYQVNGVPLAIIGQAFPYTPIAHPRHLFPEWSFGIQEQRLQSIVDETRANGARAVVLLSHNGMDVDLKLAARVRGIDAILGGHTHDGVPAPTLVGKTLVTNAGSHGKFVALLDLNVGGGGVGGYRYRLLPVFSNLLPADTEMQAHIERVRAPYLDKLSRKLALTEGLLYRRGNFNGSFDEVILDALMAVKGTEIAFSPGFRWGPTLLPGDAITFEDLMDQAAITYPQTTVNEFTGDQIKAILEDIADNLFNPDPYLQQGGDMVRVGGLTYAFDPHAPMGARIFDLRVKDLPIKSSRRYKVAGWAPVAENVVGEPIWDVVERWLRDRRTVAARAPFMPRLVGVQDNPGLG
jgi:S-sulfosulfanyl-L-cysteine sulfohydrolase